jgi:hypothetical protein
VSVGGAQQRVLSVGALARGILLGQLAPANTTAAALVTAAVRTEVTLIVICNTTGSAATARLHHDVGGSTYAANNALLYDFSVPANTTTFIEAASEFAGFSLDKDDTLGVRTGTADALTFTAYGTRETAR